MKKIIASLFLLTSLAHADEGMWLFDAFPTDKVKQKYGFTADEAWLKHVRLSSARLTGGGGCSASFVSKNGLVMSNHHCAHSCIEQLSKNGKDYIANGFYAKTLKDEVRCPEIEVDKLVETTDVTDKIQNVTKNLQGKKFNDELKATMSRLEKECSQSSDQVRCDVVTLFNGGKYHLYKYQRYQDVRLVFAPELAIAFFGGDPDNFNFPRYDLDVSFLRVYDQGKPLQTKDYFKFSKDGAKDNELTFVTGNPGGTSRLLTISQLEFLRDTKLINDLTTLSELRGLLTGFQQLGKEQKRISTAKLFQVENRLKAIKGRHAALLDTNFFDQKVAAEKKLREKIIGNSQWKKDYASAWGEITAAYKDLKNIYVELDNIERNNLNSHLFGIAKTLVRASVELPKPNEERFREFADSALPQLKLSLFSKAPIYPQFEKAMLVHSLTKLREKLGADHPFVTKVLGKQSPEELATALLKTKLNDTKLREKLYAGGAKAIEDSKDPMIRLAVLMDPDARAIRKKFEDEIETRIKQASEKVAKAQFAVNGTSTYPDATFTLRISYGQVKSYQENGHEVKPITNFEGAFARHTGREPFALPKTWLKAKSKLDLQTPFNFASTNDIIGGNSGSPVINQKAEVIGLIFDGNIQSLGGDYGFDEAQNRAVSVSTSALAEALQKIYGANRIVDGLLK